MQTNSSRIIDHCLKGLTPLITRCDIRDSIDMFLWVLAVKVRTLGKIYLIQYLYILVKINQIALFQFNLDKIS